MTVGRERKIFRGLAIGLTMAVEYEELRWLVRSVLGLVFPASGRMPWLTGAKSLAAAEWDILRSSQLAIIAVAL